MKGIIIFLFLFGNTFILFSQSVMDEVSTQILQKFDEYNIIALGERHWGQLDADLRMTIIHHPDFPNKVDDVLIEFGNSFYQNLLDSYVFGGDITYDEVAVVWQNTTQVGVWEPETYGLMIKAIRDLNLKLPKEQKVRILAVGLPIDWATISSGEDYAKQMEAFPKERGSYPALIARKDVLNKNRKAIAFFGHGQIDKNSGQVITEINRIKPGITYTIGTARAYFGDDLYFQNTYSGLEEPLLIDLSDNSIGQFEAYRFFGFKKMNEGTLFDMLDAVLYFGNLEDEVTENTSYGAVHNALLQRRKQIQRASWQYQNK